MLELASLQAMIRESLLLTDAERAYWLAGLARMTPPQIERLKGILDRAKAIPWTAALKQTVRTMAGQSKVAA